ADALRRGVARGEDVQALIAAEADLHRDSASGLDAVDRRCVVDGLEEAAEGVAECNALIGTDVASGSLWSRDAALIKGRAGRDLGSVDSWASCREGHRLGRPAVVLKRTELRILVDAWTRQVGPAQVAESGDHPNGRLAIPNRA